MQGNFICCKELKGGNFRVSSMKGVFEKKHTHNQVLMFGVTPINEQTLIFRYVNFIFDFPVWLRLVKQRKKDSVASVPLKITISDFQFHNQAAKEQKDLQTVDFGFLNCPFWSLLTSLIPARAPGRLKENGKACPPHSTLLIIMANYLEQQFGNFL